MSQPSVRAVAIDLDGTLLDTLPDLADAANRTLSELGRPPVSEQTVRQYVGNGIPRLTKRLLTGSMEGEPPPAVFEQALDAFQRHYRATLTSRTRPYAGVEAGLQLFRSHGFKLACLTNKAAAFTLPLLDATGLASCFDLVVSGDTLPRKKPDPLPLRHCAEQFGIDCAELLVIGDSATDVQTARAAGCPVFCVAYGYCAEGVQNLNCDAIVQSLPQAFERIMGTAEDSTSRDRPIPS